MAAIINPTFDSLYALKEAAIVNRALDRIGAERIADTDEVTKQANLGRAVYASTRNELIRIYPSGFAVRSTYIPEDTSYRAAMNGYGHAFMAEDWASLSGTAASSQTVTSVSPATLLVDQSIRKVLSGTNVAPGTRVLAYDAAIATMSLDRATTGAASGMKLHLPVLKFLSVDADKDALFEVVGGGEGKRILTDRETGIANDIPYLEVRYLEEIVNPDEFDFMFTEALVLRIASKLAISLARDKALAGQIVSEYSGIMEMAKKAAVQEQVVDEGEGWWTDRMIGSGPSVTGAR